MPNFNTLETQIDTIKAKIDALTATALTPEEILYVSQTIATLAKALGIDDIVDATEDAISQVQAAGTATIAVVEGTANGAAVVDLQNSYDTLQASYDNIEPRVDSLEALISLQEANIATASSLAADAGYNPWEVVTGDKLLVNKDRVFVIPNALAPNTLTLPAGPNVGNIIEIVDVAGTSGTTNFTIARNSELIQGLEEDLIFNANGAAIRLIYSGATYGWRII